MRANIHPEYTEITITCSCGHKFVTGSSLGKDLHIEVCNECHPFYTGKQKIVDTAGRVERFKGKFGSLSLNKNLDQGEAEASSKTESQAATKTATPAVTSASAKTAQKPTTGKPAAGGKSNAAAKSAPAGKTSGKNTGEKKSK